MLWVILALAVVVVVGGVVVFGRALLSDSRTQQREYRQVVPGVGPEAPANWFGSHAPEAKLHRRLRDAVKSAHAQADAPISGLATLDAAAISLDQRLIGAATLPDRHRAAVVAELEPLVARFEDSVAELARHSAPQALGGAFDDSMASIQTELEALAQAREEIDRIDRDAPPPA